MGRKIEAASRPNSSELSPASLHDAAREGDSRSLQKLLALIDPKAAEKVAAVLRNTRKSSTGSTKAPVGPCLEKGTETCTPQSEDEQGTRGRSKKKSASPLKHLLQQQDVKRRTALYVACAAGNDDVVDTLLGFGASPVGHGAWQKTPLHIAAYEGHISAVRTLLGAGADPWALNKRGQTPSDVSCVYNANGEILKLLEEAVNMRRVISKGAEGLAGMGFVHDDGQAGTVSDVLEQWSFTLEVELEGNSDVKVYLPVRGQRKLSSTRSASETLAGSTNVTNAKSAPTQQRRCEQSIPWSAQAVRRMRLESGSLLKVTIDSLVGARARTPLGSGLVVAARNVSIRCEFETETPNRAEPTTPTRRGKESSSGVDDGFDTEERQFPTPTKEIQAYDQNDGSDGCSVGTEGGACFDGNVSASEHERTRRDWSELNCAPRQGSASCTRRHAFLDNLVPLTALESVLDCGKLPPSASTLLSRARRSQLLGRWNSRISAAPPPAAASPLMSCHKRQQQASAHHQKTPPEVDDLSYIGLDLGASDDASSTEELGGRANDVDIVGLEEQIEREENSEEKMESTRIKMQATRSAVHEALVLWSSKADLLQARLKVLRTVASSSTSTTLGSTISAAENTYTSTMSLEEYLASPLPRCCACDKRGGYQKATSSAPPLDKRASVSIPSEVVEDNNGSLPYKRDSSVGSQPSSVGGRMSPRGHFRDVPKRNGDYHDSRKDAVEGEERLIAHLHECLKQMTHLRNWLRVLDNEID